MLDLLMKLNELKPVDKWFFIICAVMIGAIVGIYFLIPVLNQKQYREQRENLKKREQAFKSNAHLQQDPVAREEKEDMADSEVAAEEVPSESEETVSETKEEKPARRTKKKK